MFRSDKREGTNIDVLHAGFLVENVVELPEPEPPSKAYKKNRQ